MTPGGPRAPCCDKSPGKVTSAGSRGLASLWGPVKQVGARTPQTQGLRLLDDLECLQKPLIFGFPSSPSLAQLWWARVPQARSQEPSLHLSPLTTPTSSCWVSVTRLRT